MWESPRGRWLLRAAVLLDLRCPCLWESPRGRWLMGAALGLYEDVEVPVGWTAETAAT